MTPGVITSTEMQSPSLSSVKGFGKAVSSLMWESLDDVAEGSRLQHHSSSFSGGNFGKCSKILIKKCSLHNLGPVSSRGNATINRKAAFLVPLSPQAKQDHALLGDVFRETFGSRLSVNVSWSAIFFLICESPLGFSGICKYSSRRVVLSGTNRLLPEIWPIRARQNSISRLRRNADADLPASRSVDWKRYIYSVRHCSYSAGRRHIYSVRRCSYSSGRRYRYFVRRFSYFSGRRYIFRQAVFVLRRQAVYKFRQALFVLLRQAMYKFRKALFVLCLQAVYIYSVRRCMYSSGRRYIYSVRRCLYSAYRRYIYSVTRSYSSVMRYIYFVRRCAYSSGRRYIYSIRLCSYSTDRRYIYSVRRRSYSAGRRYIYSVRRCSYSACRRYICIGYHMASGFIIPTPEGNRDNSPRRSRGLLARFPEGGGMINPESPEKAVWWHTYIPVTVIKARCWGSLLCWVAVAGWVAMRDLSAGYVKMLRGFKSSFFHFFSFFSFFSLTRNT